MLPSSLFNSYGTLQAVTKLHIVNFSVMIPCSLVEEYQAFLSGTIASIFYPDDGGSAFLQNVGTKLTRLLKCQICSHSDGWCPPAVSGVNAIVLKPACSQTHTVYHIGLTKQMVPVPT